MPKVRKLSQQEIRELETTPEPPESAENADHTLADVDLLDDAFPHLAAWVDERGWIEIGADEYSHSFIRVLDSGGMVWEGKTHYPSLVPRSRLRIWHSPNSWQVVHSDQRWQR